MSMEDSNVERRNLMVTSIAFIAYFYSNGKIASNEVQIQVINVVFSDPTVLVAMAWILLFWFFYRYWLAHQGDFRKGFNKELYSLIDTKILQDFLSKKLEPPQPSVAEGGWCATQFLIENNSLVVQCRYYQFVSINEEGRISKDHPQGTFKKISLSDYKGRIVKVRLYLFCMINRPSFSDLLVPYILFLLALLGPVYRYFFY